MALVQTAPSAPAAAAAAAAHVPRPAHRLRAAHLNSLPIARDGLGRSFFTFTSQQPSPKTPQPSSPFDSLRAVPHTPRWKHAPSPRSPPQSLIADQLPQFLGQPAQPSLPAQQLLHLERCFEAPSVAGTQQLPTINTSAFMQSLKPVASDFDCIAYQGTPTGRALSNVYPHSNAIRYQQSEDVFVAVQHRKAGRALLPVENTLDGSNHRTYDLLLRHNLHIVGEMLCPAAVSQNCSPASVLDPLLNATPIDLFSRFWVLAKDPVMPRPEENFKTTVALVLADGLGALYKILSAFAFRDIKVTKIESRPWRHEPLRKVDRGEAGVAKYFQYVLFVDFLGSMADRAAQNALSQLQQHSSFLRVLGSYPTIDLARGTKTNREAHMMSGPTISALLSSSIAK